MPRPHAWVGIDPSYSKFALVCLSEDGQQLEHAEDFSPGRAGSGGGRLSFIHASLRVLFATLDTEFSVQQVAIEGYAPGAKFHREVLGELGGVVRLAVHEALFPACGEALIVPPASVKKFATGKGQAEKSDMKLAVFKKWGAEFHSHDLADAYTVARVARAVTVGTDLKYEADVLAALNRAGKKSRASA